MKYLLIENKGQSDLNAFLMLGISTTRASDQKLIGKFGSGIKHGIITLLRKKVDFSLFLGTDQVKFYARQEKISSIDGECFFDVVYARYKGEDIRTGFTLQFGAMDWTRIEMAIREIISNALDASMKTAGNSSDCTIKEVTEISGVSNSTRVFIEMTEEVEFYYHNLGFNFLHFSLPNVDLNLTFMLDKAQQSSPAIYRRGVLVAEEASDHKSLFNYNLEDVELDESRNLKVSEAYTIVGKSFFKLTDNQFRNWLSHIHRENLFENRLDSWQIIYYNRPRIDERQETLIQIWNEVYPNGVLVRQNCSREIAQKITHKGFTPVVACDTTFAILDRVGIPTPNSFLSETESSLHNVQVAPLWFIEIVDGVWELLFSGLAQNLSRPFPSVFTFSKNEGSSVLFGFANNSSIYFNEDYISKNPTKDLYRTIIEEMAHYVFQAEDTSMLMQQSLINMLAETLPNRF